VNYLRASKINCEIIIFHKNLLFLKSTTPQTS